MVISFLMTLISGNVYAYTVPLRCQDDFNVRPYNLGLEKGRLRVENEWYNVEQNCTAITATPDFKNAVMEIVNDLSIPPNSIDFVVCHVYGYMNGIADALREIDADCPLQCLMDGELVGKLAAMMYCELAIGFGGIPSSDFTTGILSVCSPVFTDDCESSFDDVTIDYSDVFGIECAPYTLPPYEIIMQTDKQNQCVFVP
jgi:hypothetical protein